MTRTLRIAGLALGLCVAALAVFGLGGTGPGLFGQPLHAQTTQQFQSLSPSRGACTTGSQSIRVCSNDLQSCNSVCTARALDPSSDIAGCSTRCCTQFNVCLRLRGCGARVINCQ